MLPLSLLKTAQGHLMLVELKNGETYNGHLVNCDTWMNIHLREVICTSKMEIDFGECQNATFVAIQLSTSEFQMRLSSSLDEGHTTIVVKALGEANATSHCLVPERLGDKRRSPGPEVIDKVQEETKSQRSDRKPPGVGRGRGRRRGRDENSVGRSSKGIGRGGIDDGGGRGGRGKGLSGGKPSGNRGGGR